MIWTFRFTAVDSGDLKDALVGLGAKDMFHSKRADLSGIVKVNKNPVSRVDLDHIVYKTKVDIIEEGSFPLHDKGKRLTQFSNDWLYKNTAHFLKLSNKLVYARVLISKLKKATVCINNSLDVIILYNHSYYIKYHYTHFLVTRH